MASVLTAPDSPQVAIIEKHQGCSSSRGRRFDEAIKIFFRRSIQRDFFQLTFAAQNLHSVSVSVDDRLQFRECVKSVWSIFDQRIPIHRNIWHQWSGTQNRDRESILSLRRKVSKHLNPYQGEKYHGRPTQKCSTFRLGSGPRVGVLLDFRSQCGRGRFGGNTGRPNAFQSYAVRIFP